MHLEIHSLLHPILFPRLASIIGLVDLVISWRRSPAVASLSCPHSELSDVIPGLRVTVPGPSARDAVMRPAKVPLPADTCAFTPSALPVRASPSSKQRNSCRALLMAEDDLTHTAGTGSPHMRERSMCRLCILSLAKNAKSGRTVSPDKTDLRLGRGEGVVGRALEHWLTKQGSTASAISIYSVLCLQSSC